MMDVRKAVENMTLRHLEELEEREKRKAAVHEAGHATVAATKGVRVDAWIHRNESGDPGEKAWLGHVRNVPRFVWQDGKPALADDLKTLGSTYAVAGMVAEELHDSPKETYDSIVENWKLGLCTPSPADLELCSEDWRERSKAVAEAVRILRDQMPLFDRIVAELLEHRSLADGHIAFLAAQLLTAGATPAKEENGNA